jgi:hypothetical protein
MSPRLFVLAAAACLTLPGVAFAGEDIVTPRNCTAPTHISIMGVSAGGDADPHSEVVIVARGILGAPLDHSQAMVEFGSCPDVALCLDFRDANVHMDCAHHLVWKFTNAAGEARFRFIGSLKSPSAAAGLAGCANVAIDGILIDSPSVAIYDLTGNDGVTPQDLAVWLGDFFSGSAPLRDDYNGDGSVGAADLSSWLNVYFAGSSVSNCGTGGDCP